MKLTINFNIHDIYINLPVGYIFSLSKSSPSIISSMVATITWQRGSYTLRRKTSKFNGKRIIIIASVNVTARCFGAK